MPNQALNFLVSGVAPRRLGNAHPNLVPYQLFTVADGELVIAVGNDAQFRRLVELLGIPELAVDPRARTNADRVQHRAAVVARIQGAVLAWTRAELASRLAAEIYGLNILKEKGHPVYRALLTQMASAQAESDDIRASLSFKLRNGFLNVVHGCDAARLDQRLSSKLAYLVGRLLKPPARRMAKTGDIGSGLSQSHGNRLSDPRVGTGDEGSLIGERERDRHAYRLLR